MKNKKNIYFLLPAVLIIWGFLAYKIINGLQPSTQNVQAIKSIEKFKPQALKEADTFSISTNYRDPFLGTIQKEKKVNKARRKIAVKKETIPFPRIAYRGLVSPKGDNKKVYLVSVSGQQHLFKRNTVFNEVKLLSGNAEEVTLKFQGQKQTFSLEK